MSFLKSALKGTLAAAVVAGSLAASAGAASAYVVCNGQECWHTHSRFAYPTGVGVAIHPNAWGMRHHDGYQWRNDRFDRGYYNNGAWIGF